MRASAFGKAGHALEVEVENLFTYNGFSAERNRVTTKGEIDVVAKFQDYDAAIECKEYNLSSTAVITRDIISGIAKKAELVGAKNAVLVTTKEVTQGLRDHAREAGVVVMTHGDIERIKRELLAIQDPTRRPLHLVSRFQLSNSAESADRIKRREFLRALATGKIGVGQAVADISTGRNARLFWGVVLGAVAVVALAAVIFPAFRTWLLAVALGVGVVAYYLQDAKKPRRRPRRRSRA